jgi:hypothetical protein
MKKKFIIITVIVIILSGALFLVNIFLGNPISRINAQKETIQYYENTYNEKFKVYDSKYNPLIPAYIFELGPVNNKNIRFDTGLFSQGITDEYGGIIAALKLSKDVGAILEAEYGHLNYEVSAAEEPLVWYAGESADYFETDPNKRVLNNHYNLIISLPDGSISQNELEKIATNMSKKIETELPYQTPNLRVYINFKSELSSMGSDTKLEGKKYFELFSTMN